MYKIKLPKTEIAELRLNGNNFISDTEVGMSMFEDLSSVEITDTDTGISKTFTDMRLIHVTQVGKEFWFALEEKSPYEKAIESIRTNSDDLTDVQMALAEIYEMMIGSVGGV